MQGRRRCLHGLVSRRQILDDSNNRTANEGQQSNTDIQARPLLSETVSLCCHKPMIRLHLKVKGVFRSHSPILSFCFQCAGGCYQPFLGLQSMHTGEVHLLPCLSIAAITVFISGQCDYASLPDHKCCSPILAGHGSQYNLLISSLFSFSSCVLD